MRKLIGLVLLALFCCSACLALTADEQAAYEKALVAALGAEAIGVTDEGVRMYKAEVLPHILMEKWNAVVANPPRRAAGTRTMTSWQIDGLAREAGLHEGHIASFQTGDGSQYSVSIVRVAGGNTPSFFMFEWKEAGKDLWTPSAEKPTGDGALKTVTGITERFTSISSPDVTFSAGFSPDGRRIAAGGTEGQVRVFETATGKAVGMWQGHTKLPGADHEYDDGVCSVMFTPDGERVISVAVGGEIKSWTETGKLLSSASVKGLLLQAAMSPGGQTVAVAGINLADGSGEYDWATGKLKKRFVDDAYAVAYDASGTLIAFLSHEDEPCRIVVFEVRTGRLLHEFPGPEAGVLGKIQFSPNGKLVSAVLEDGVLATVSLADNRLLYAKQAGGQPVKDIAYTPDGRLLLVSLANANLALDPATGEGRVSLPTSYMLYPMVLSRDGAYLSSGYAILTGKQGGIGVVLSDALVP